MQQRIAARRPATCRFDLRRGRTWLPGARSCRPDFWKRPECRTVRLVSRRTGTPWRSSRSQCSGQGACVPRLFRREPWLRPGMSPRTRPPCTADISTAAVPSHCARSAQSACWRGCNSTQPHNCGIRCICPGQSRPASRRTVVLMSLPCYAPVISSAVVGTAATDPSACSTHGISNRAPA